jgi:large subunit ribosomal protein L4
MISVPIRNKAGQDVGTYKFDPNELAPGINKQLLHDVVVMYEANRRVGTVKTKSRGEVEGSTQKMYRQKGTGRARAGARRTPVRRGGGHTFAKAPVDWGYRLPRKAVKLATRMALLSKFLDDQVTVLDDLVLDEPKTKVVAGILKALGLDETTCLLTIESHDPLVWRSSRNIANLRVSPASDLNAYDLLHQKRLLVTTAAMDRLRGQGGETGESSAREK